MNQTKTEKVIYYTDNIIELNYKRYFLNEACVYENGPLYWRCKKCGVFIRKDALTDCIDTVYPKYCPNCRAKINYEL